MGNCCERLGGKRVQAEEQTTPLLSSKNVDNNENESGDIYPAIMNLGGKKIQISESIEKPVDSKAAEDIIPEPDDIDEEYDSKMHRHIVSSVSDFNLDQRLHEGYIVKFNGNDLIKYYGILHGVTLNLYVSKPINNDITKHRNIYDMMNMSQFYDLDKYKIDESDEKYQFGITFADHFGEFDIECFMFENEFSQNKWYEAFKSVMDIDQDIINNNNN
eukprot:176723_1